MKSDRKLAWKLTRSSAAGVLCVMWMSGLSGALAQQPAAPASAPADAAQRAPIMVSVEAQGANDQDVILTYAIPVSEAQVRKDIAALQQSTGWVVDHLQITSSENPYKPSSARLYSAQFTTVDALDDATGHLPLAPVVTALRHYGKLIVLFDVEGPFVYRGKQSYHDSTLDIQMIHQAAGSGTYGFRVDVAPSGSPLHFDGIAASQDQAGSQGRLALRLVASLLLALLVGGLAYAGIVRLMLRAEGSTGS